MSEEILHTTERQYPFDAQKWFQVDQVAKNVWGIREPHHDQDVVSYFIEGQTQDILIDSGMGLANIGLSSPLSERDTEKKLTTLLTHTHWDHMGGAADFSNVIVFNNEFEISRIRSGWKPREMPGFTQEYFINTQIPDSFSPDTFTIPGVTQVQVLNDRQIINLGNDILHTIATPGHTPGSTSFYLENAGYLFTGDTLYVGPLYFHMKESDHERLLSSIQKLISSIGKLSAVFPAHNDTSLTPGKFEELLSIIKGDKKPDFKIEDTDDFNEFTQFGWHMKDMGENRKFSIMLPRGTRWPI